MTNLELKLIGPFKVFLAGKPVTAFKSNKVRALLAYLAAEASQPHQREDLAARFWPDWPPQAALNNLRNALVDLRNNIGDRQTQPSFLLITAESIQLNLESNIQVDLWDFEQNASPKSTSSQLQEAISLFHGQFMEGFTLPDSSPCEEWLTVRREALKRQVVQALRRLVEYHEERSEFDQALSYAYRQVEMEPWLEEAHQQIMRLLARRGQRSEALAQYEQCRKLLATELGVEPGSATRKLYEEIRDGSLAGETQTLSKPPSGEIIETSVERVKSRRHNLPLQLTSFVGREKELAVLRSLLTEGKARLVTMTGPGGTGKTRLALMAASGLVDRFTNGVFLIELASLTDPSRVVSTLAAVFGLREQAVIPLQDTLAGYLETKQLLLILDNCEHLIEECARLVDVLLKRCPGLEVLVTSREVLGVGGETVVRVPPLELPDAKHMPSLETLGQVEAVRLFVERAQQSMPGFSLEAGNATAVAQICQRLDGIPLALELAAARLRIMAINQITTRLDDVFRLLTGGSRSVMPRQQTLKATLDWSYALLSPQEKITLQRLSVFAGSWTIEAAEAVCAGEGIERYEVLDLLGGLVEKSLVMLSSTEHGEGRYRMLETVRQYAHDRLLESGEGERVRDFHLAYYLQMGKAFEANVRSREQIDWLGWMEREVDNLRLALEWSQAGHVIDGLRLSSALVWFWRLHAHDVEGVSWLEKLLETEVTQQDTQPLAAGVQNNTYLLVWVRAVIVVVFLATYHPGSLSIERRKAMLDQAIAHCRELGEAADWDLAWALIESVVSFPLPSWELGINCLEEVLGICLHLGDAVLHADCLLNIAYYYFYSGQMQLAGEYAQESLAIFRQVEDQDAIARSLGWLSWVSRGQSDYTRAYALCSEAQEYFRKIGNLSDFYIYYFFQLFNALELEENLRVSQQAENALAYLKEKGDIPFIYIGLVNISEVEWARGNFKRAQEMSEEACTLNQKYHLGSESYHLLGRIALTQGNLGGARRLIKLSLSEITREISTPTAIVWFLSGWVVLLAAEGKMSQAIKISSAIDGLFLRVAPVLTPRYREEYAAAKATARQTLGEETFAQVWEEGQKLTLSQALQLAKEETD